MLEWRGGQPYRVAQGYKWQPQLKDKAPWEGFIWSRAKIPSHAFISLIFIQGRLPTKIRLARFSPQQSVECPLCPVANEDEMHLFYTCNFGRTVWEELRKWWAGISTALNKAQVLNMFKHTNEPKTSKLITRAIMSATICNFWRARNDATFNNHTIPVLSLIHIWRCRRRG